MYKYRPVVEPEPGGEGVVCSLDAAAQQIGFVVAAERGLDGDVRHHVQRRGSVPARGAQAIGETVGVDIEGGQARVDIDRLLGHGHRREEGHEQDNMARTSELREVKKLDQASAVTMPYPYWRQRQFKERNPFPTRV